MTKSVRRYILVGSLALSQVSSGATVAAGAGTNNTGSVSPNGVIATGGEQPNPRPPSGPRVGNLPDIEIVRSGEETSLLSIRAMGTTMGIKSVAGDKFSIQAGKLLNEQVKDGFQVYKKIELVDFETDAVADFLQGKGVFASADSVASRGVIVSRYGVEDPDAEKFLIDAKNMGAHSLVLITDGPISADSKLAKFGTRVDREGRTVPADFTNDIQPEYLIDRGNGLVLKNLLKSGWQMRTPTYQPKTGEMIQPGDYFFTMSALGNPALDRNPIMHQKEVIMYIVKDSKKALSLDNLKALYVMHGTGNWTRIHINRNFLSVDDLSVEKGQMGVFALRHALANLETFAREGKSAQIDDVPTVGRRRVVAKDGSFIESAYTDGKFELNQRIADELSVLAGDLPTMERLAKGDSIELQKLKDHSANAVVDEIILSHFVLTNGRVVEALRDLWIKKNSEGKPFKVTGGLDAKFVGLRSFGMGAMLAGYNVRTPYGKVLRSLGKEFQKSVSMTVMMETRPDAIDIDPDGPPHERVLLHDKTTVILMHLKNSPIGEMKEWSMTFTGSYNASGNFRNLERQDIHFVPASNPVSQAIVTSIRSAMNQKIREKQKALPLNKGVYVIEMARFLGQTETDLNWSEIEEFRALVENLQSKTKDERKQDLARINIILKKNASGKSRLLAKLQVTPEVLNLRLAAMTRFFNWYTDQPFNHQAVEKNVNSGEMLGLVMSIMEKSLSAKMSLNDIFWRPNIPVQVLEARSYAVFKYMGLESMFLKQGLAAEDAKFPWNPNTVFTSELINDTMIRAANKKFAAGDTIAAAQIIQSWIVSYPKIPATKAALAASVDVISARLSGFKRMLEWYEQLPLDVKSKVAAVGIKAPDLAAQLLTENLDLLVLKDQPADRVLATIKYLVSLKGYRDGFEGAPGKLTELTTVGMAELEKNVTSEQVAILKEVRAKEFKAIVSPAISRAGDPLRSCSGAL